MPRLLVCKTHKTVDVLPDYDTAKDMEGRNDHALLDAIEAHKNRTTHDMDKHRALILRIEPEEFELLDPNRLQQALMDDSLESYIKEEREQKKHDALACYQIHDRPTYGIGYGIGCPDYRSDSRAIGATKGIPKENRMYLCDFCPYQSYVEHAQNKKVKFRGEK